MSLLRPVAPQVWIADQNHRMLGLALGARMTVVDLGGGRLWVHSPIAWTPALAAQIDALGQVAFLVAPNAFHHVYLPAWVEAYPRATVVGAEGVTGKRRDVDFAATLGGGITFDGLRQQHVGGSMLDETVFLHEPTGTLISCDLFENFQTCDHWATRTYLKVGGVYGKPGLHPVIRLVYRDRKRARADVAKVLEWDFDRVIISHGAIVTEGAQAQTERGVAWLMG